MPYLRIRTAAAVAEEKKISLQKEICSMITLIPGKSAANTMVDIEGDCSMYLGGEAKRALFCEIRLFGEAPAESKGALCNRLHALFLTELSVEKSYINFQEFPEWGTDGLLRRV